MTEEQTPEKEEGVNNLFCFMDKDRVCGPDCMAFITFPRPAKSSELSEFQSHCSLLLSAERVGRNVTIAASELVRKGKSDKLAAIDEERNRNATAPVAGPFSQPTSPFPRKNS